ncbi:MAG: hypothetical protein IT366_15340 [Candidatus Hydrogenedentes bacterium]|nr:hypothetical protein [Candidatus Hydrogenedentota bacterium]
MRTQADHSNLATRRGFLTTTAFASASLLSLTATGRVKVHATWTNALNLVEDGAVGEVRYISAMVPPDDVMDAYMASLCILSPAREVKSEEASHFTTSAYSMRHELEGGAKIAVAAVSENRARRITIQGSEGSIHIVGDVVSVQSRGAWREFNI